MASWVIEVNPDETCDLKLNGRIVAYDLDDEDEALDRVRQHRNGGKGTKVTVYEADGYPTPVVA